MVASTESAQITDARAGTDATAAGAGGFAMAVGCTGGT
jgi:hypothetical protein